MIDQVEKSSATQTPSFKKSRAITGSIAGVAFLSVAFSLVLKTSPIGINFPIFYAASILSIGIGSVTCFLISFFPVWERLWAVFNRPLVLISGVIFLHERIPELWQTYLWYNPLVHIVGGMRRGFYPSYQSEYVEIMYPIGMGMVLLVIGLVLLNRYNRDILNLY